MKKSLMGLFAGAVLLAPVAVFAAESKMVQGEILDMACYMGHEAKGPGHAKCAAACLKDGSPAGLLTKDGQVYLLVEDHSAKKPYAAARDMAAEQVMVTGEVSSRGGVQAIVVKGVEKAK